MQERRTNRSRCRVLWKGKTVGYLTEYMCGCGLDSQLDMAGYTIVCL